MLAAMVAGCNHAYAMGLSFELVWGRALRPLLFSLDPELAHRVALTLLSGVPAYYGADDAPALRQNLWGLRFSNPLGLAAGLDKDAAALPAWQMLRFGFAEVGTITPRPQPGNPRPRLWRLAEHRALINRLGFPSRGMQTAARRLSRFRKRRHTLLIGVNLGPNRFTSPDRVADDISTAASLLSAMADFIVINVSSPNTPGLREWQAPEHLRRLITLAFPERTPGPRAPSARRPALLVKIAPDLDSQPLRELCATITGLHLDGIVATNTTITRDAVGVRCEYPGGLSGQPLKARAREVISAVYRYTEGSIPIIGVGGVASAEDAYGHICAGASLVELYTGLIYEGPGLPRSIKKGLEALTRRDGHDSIAQAVGKAALSGSGGK
jgi:dihydroorotate dehydrogenase